MKPERSNLKKRDNGVITFTCEITWLASLYGHGWGNGYFALPEGHPWYGKDYDDIPADVHYGWTYAEAEEIDGKEYWVVGFDTCHGMDTIEKWPEETLVNYIDEIFSESFSSIITP